MKKQFLVSLLVAGSAFFSLSTLAAPLTDLSDGQTGHIEFVSSTPEHRQALVNGRLGPAVTAAGDLLMPSGTSDAKVPAVVFAHGSEGAAPRYYDYWTKELNRNGFAVFIVDS